MKLKFVTIGKHEWSFIFQTKGNDWKTTILDGARTVITWNARMIIIIIIYMVLWTTHFELIRLKQFDKTQKSLSWEEALFQCYMYWNAEDKCLSNTCEHFEFGSAYNCIIFC